MCNSQCHRSVARGKEDRGEEGTVTCNPPCHMIWIIIIQYPLAAFYGPCLTCSYPSTLVCWDGTEYPSPLLSWDGTAGLIFPPFVYRGRIESEALGLMARDIGVQPYGMPRLFVSHA